MVFANEAGKIIGIAILSTSLFVQWIKKRTRHACPKKI